MGTNETILQKMQAGIESSPGTPVAATRILTGRGVLNYNHPLGNISEQNGSFDDRSSPVYGRQQVGVSYSEALSYETLPWWGQLFMKGGVAGVSDSGTPTPGYAYGFTPSSATDDLKAVTLEVGEPGNPYEIAQSMVNTATIRLDGDSTDEPAWMLEADFVGLSLVNTSYTGALTLAARESIAAPGTKVYIDNGGGTPGTTQVLGKIISASVTWNLNRHLKGFLENEDTMAPGKSGRGPRVVDAQITMEFDSDSEFANYRSATPVERIIQLKREGSIIHSTVKKSAAITLAGYWSTWSPGDREGNMIATFGLAAYKNSALGYSSKLEVLNGLSTLP